MLDMADIEVTVQTGFLLQAQETGLKILDIICTLLLVFVQDLFKILREW